MILNTVTLLRPYFAQLFQMVTVSVALALTLIIVALKPWQT